MISLSVAVIRATLLKEYFSNYLIHQSDVTVDIKNNTLEILNSVAEPWKITMIDTGYSTMTGGAYQAYSTLC